MRRGQRIGYSISATTRGRRTGERHGRDYFFMTVRQFKDGIKRNDFLEWAKVFGNYYGTLKGYVQRLQAQGKDVILDIDVQGAQQLMRKGVDATYIFMLPPNVMELKRRLMKRRTDTRATIQKRLSLAKKEMACAPRYDYIMVNKKIAETMRVIKMIIQSEKYKTK